MIGTLVVEIWAAPLILAPTRALRLSAVALNVGLMAVIALTGNYNFFNLLTAVLMIPLVDVDVSVGAGGRGGGGPAPRQREERATRLDKNITAHGARLGVVGAERCIG